MSSAELASKVDAAAVPADMGVVDLINNLLVPAYGDLDWPQWFGDRAIRASTPSQLKNTPYDGRVIMIKYMEHNRDWAKWARECRGIIVRYAEQGDGRGRWIPIRYALQRGAEVLTGLHVKHGISHTQDTSHEQGAPQYQLAPSQQQLVKIFVDGGDLADGSVLSMKSDGSLLCATLYRGQLVDEMARVIAQHGDDFSRTALAFYQASGMMIILSSQGTLFLPETVQDYTAHAVLATIGMSESQIASVASTCTPAESVAKFAGPFFAKLSQMFQAYPAAASETLPVTSITLNFESVVRNRTTAWGIVHVELAIDYPESRLSFLGGAVCFATGEVHCDPHFTLLRHNVNAAPSLPEPYWWPVKSSAEVESMMEALDAIIQGQKKPLDFVMQFPPQGLQQGLTNATPPQLDYEGFVMYTPVPSTASATVVALEYNKIKTNSYYISHKFKFRNVEQLIKLAATAGHIFPLIRLVRDFFQSLAPRLVAAISSVHAELAKGKTSIFFQGIACNPKAAASFERQPFEVKLKMLVNLSGPIFSDFCFAAFQAQFRELGGVGVDRKEIDALLKSIAMKYCISEVLEAGRIEQDADLLQQVKKQRVKLQQDDELLRQLFAVCLTSGDGGDGS